MLTRTDFARELSWRSFCSGRVCFAASVKLFTQSSPKRINSSGTPGLRFVSSMERGIFGSTISLGGLLNDSFLTDGETDQFLKEFEQGVPKDLLDVPACGEADSGATSLNSTFSGTYT